MTVSANYPIPVWVNGYACDNCAQVAEAKQGVDPADPRAGPYGIDASAPASPSQGGGRGQTPAVLLGGALSGLAAGQSAPSFDALAAGAQLNISV